MRVRDKEGEAPASFLASRDCSNKTCSFCPNLAVSHLSLLLLSVFITLSCQAPSYLSYKTCPGAAFSRKLSRPLLKLYITWPCLCFYDISIIVPAMSYRASLFNLLSSVCRFVQNILKYLLCSWLGGFSGDTDTHRLYLEGAQSGSVSQGVV